nr:uncharacterized protein LOC127309259 [Lolium perenne]
MAPRRKWKAAPAAKKNLLTPQPPGPDAQVQEQLHWLADQETERWKTAIRAILAAENECAFPFAFGAIIHFQGATGNMGLAVFSGNSIPVWCLDVCVSEPI